MYFLRLALAFNIAVLHGCSLNGQPVLLPDENEPIKVLEHFEVLVDSNVTLGFPRIFTIDGFNPVNDESVTLPSGAVYWVRFFVYHEEDTDQRAYLALTASDFYAARLYLHEEGRFPESPLRLQQRQAIFPLDVPPNDTIEGYLYLDRRYLPVTTQFRLITANGLAENELQFGFGGGLYTGAGLLYLLLAILVLMLLRSRESFYFMLYVAGSMLYLFYSRGEPLSMYMEKWQIAFLFDALPYASVALSTIGHIGIFHIYFQMRKRPLLNRIIVSIQFVSFVLFLLLLAWPVWVRWYFGSYELLVYGVAVVSLAALIVILVAGGTITWRERKNDQLYFLFTFSPMLLLVLYIWLAEGKVVPRSALVFDNAPGLLVFYEGTVLGGMLVYRYFRERLRLLDSLHNERREIIHDLHSGLLPEMDALRDVNDRLIQPLDEEIYARVDQLNGEISEDLRMLMWTLGRENGEHLDALVGRLRGKVKSRFADLPGEARLLSEPTIMPEGIAVPFALSYHLFHFVKEAVNNAAKHADCTMLDCQLEYTGYSIHLSIIDDGRGFAYPAEGKGNGHGLKEMKQRADKMGAEFTWESSPGEGTRIWLKVPVPRGVIIK